MTTRQTRQRDACVRSGIAVRDQPFRGVPPPQTWRAKGRSQPDHFNENTKVRSISVSPATFAQPCVETSKTFYDMWRPPLLPHRQQQNDLWGHNFTHPSPPNPTVLSFASVMASEHVKTRDGRKGGLHRAGCVLRLSGIFNGKRSATD